MAVICVFCSSSLHIDGVHLDLAGRLGTVIAARGHSLVSGGGRVSMMGAVAAAARAGGAHTLGVIPHALHGREVADHEADELLVTPGMRERKALMDSRSDAFVVLPGGIGTLEELLEMWVSRSLGMHDKPIILCDPTGLYARLHDLVDHLTGAGFVRPEAAGLLHWTSSADEAVAAVETALAPPPGPTVVEVVE